MGRWNEEDDNGAVAVLSSEFGPFRRATPVRRDPEPEADFGYSSTQSALRAMEEAVRHALRIVLSLPPDRMLAGLRGGRSCLASIIVCELDADKRVMLKSAKQITEALNLIDDLLALEDVDPFAIKVVLFRAMPKKISWEKISAEDPKGRGRRQLYNLHREALISLWNAVRYKK